MGSAEDALAAPRSSGFASDADAEQVSAGAPRSQAAKLRPTTTRKAVADGGAMNERERTDLYVRVSGGPLLSYSYSR